MVYPTINDIAIKKSNVFSEAESYLEHLCQLKFNEPVASIRHSAIMCTLGQASKSVKVLEKMMANGMNLVRIACQTGTHEWYNILIDNAREAANNYSKRIGYEYPIAIGLDTKGAEIRTGLIGGDKNVIKLIKNEQIKLTIDEAFSDQCNNSTVYVDYENIVNILKPGNQIYIDNGLIRLEVQEIIGKNIECNIEVGGILGSDKIINLPGIPVDLPLISEKDKLDILFALEKKVDILLLSFARNAEEIKEVRSMIDEAGEKISLISKIENQQGLDNIDEIIEASDGIMIARGDLGLEIPLEQVFLAQKLIAAKCNLAGKPVICAYQMLHSMTTDLIPTRAEVSDCGNAVIDGCDCLLLSNESSIGKYPVECVNMMAKACKEAEMTLWYTNIFKALLLKAIDIDVTDSVAIASVEASFKINATAIICLTTTGRSVYAISKYKPKCPILAVTRVAKVARQLNLYRSVVPIIYDKPVDKTWTKDVDNRVEYCIKTGKKFGFIITGDPIIVVTGWRPGAGFTNTMRIVYASINDDIRFDCNCFNN